MYCHKPKSVAREFDLCQRLYRQGKTLVLVLHDINLALRYASHLLVMKEGRVYAESNPEEIVTEQRIADVFGLAYRIIRDPEFNRPLIMPKYKTNE
ncbi:ferric enterobactin transport protein (ABC superfamily, atp_bind) (fragment) [Xenorhabdus poinarii G6]|uniref:Ferric enterobactin transport protein (ABC superfamily, atp_bind) n=1 Tax=Xenorhabdus poinarii G6 TaxID=1354304 RepID=A0A068R7K3_9GAMM